MKQMIVKVKLIFEITDTPSAIGTIVQYYIQYCLHKTILCKLRNILLIRLGQNRKLPLSTGW